MRGLKIFSLVVALAFVIVSCGSGHERCPAYGGFNIENQDHDGDLKASDEVREEEKA